MPSVGHDPAPGPECSSCEATLSKDEAVEYRDSGRCPVCGANASLVEQDADEATTDAEVGHDA